MRAPTTTQAAGQATIGDATFTVEADRTVLIEVEGGTYRIEQVQVMAGLTADPHDLPGWASTALYVHAGLIHAPGVPVSEVLRVAGMQWRDRAAMTQAPRLHPMLARDPHETVRARLAQMTGMLTMTVDIQVLLAGDPSWDVRMDLAKCGATLAAEAGLILADDTDQTVVFTLADKTVHPDVLVAAFTTLVRDTPDDVDRVHTLLQRRMGVPEPLWTLLTAHPRWELRAWAAMSGFCPLDLLDRLTADPHETVSRYAADTLARAGQGRL